jgi:probable F420-dependent oxidoreductase
MHDVKFGIFLPTGDFAQARAVAQRADAQGFYSISINDHFFAPGQKPETPQLECFTTLSALAAVTKRVRIAPAMTAMSFRNPALLAKMAATLDVISGGCVTLGVGAGWMRDEYHAHDYPYPTNRERLAQLGDALKIIKAMWTEDAPTYHGRFFKVEKAYNHPRPIQRPYPPIMIGGSGRKLLEISGAEADIANLAPPLTRGALDTAAFVKFDKPRLAQKIEMLREFARSAGRDPETIEISGFSTLTLSNDRSQIEAAVAGTMKMMGFSSAEAVRNSPSMLFGTPAEVRAELHSRIEEFGMSYFILAGAPDAIELFVKEVMPEFQQ